MSILATELVCYASADRPTDDRSTSGGACDNTMRVLFTQFSAPALLALVSDEADTRSAAIAGRNAVGAYISESVNLNGITEVVSVNTYERILSVQLSGASNYRTVTLKEGSGGSTVASIPIKERGITAMFIDSKIPVGSLISPVTTDRYEKLFWKNTNAIESLMSSQVTLTADPAGKIMIGLDSSLNNSSATANRTTAPAGVSFVDDAVAVNVPNAGNITYGAAVGVWIKESLSSADAAVKSTFTTELSGETTES